MNSGWQELHPLFFGGTVALNKKRRALQDFMYRMLLPFLLLQEEVQPRNNCKHKRAFFQDASSTPQPPLSVRYCLAIQKSNLELFHISQSSFPFSQHSFRCKRSVPGPLQRGLSCLRRVRSQPSECKAPQDCFQDGGCAVPS